MRERVALQAAPDYRRPDLENALVRLLAPLGGMAAFVRPGQNVLLKPNMLSGKEPSRAVTTHPEIVRAVILLVQKAGGKVSVGDSPGLGSPQQVARACGIQKVLDETGAAFAPFTESVKIRPQGRTFHELEIARDILDADVVINLPKLKTHQMIGMTCGVKNLFGAVIGIRKPRLHLQAGTDKGFFALMLLELAEQIRPALTIVDAITAMEGDGPGSGDPIQVGALLAGASPLAVDTVAAEMIGLSPPAVWTLRVARETGRPGCRLEQVEILGERLEDLRVRGFRAAKATDVNFGLPPLLKNLLKNSLSAFPVVAPEHCKLCGICTGSCPPGAMKITDALEIDYKRCIGCFCCQELCPCGALLTRQGLLLRLARLLNHR